MLLRRIMKHVNAQNWFAVGVDFVIVVVGVYIGIEVTNWNDVRNNKTGLVASLERLDKEVSQNIEIIEKVLITFEEGREDLELSSDALNNCAFSPDAEAALERSLWDLTHDVQPNFTTIALDELAGPDDVRIEDTGIEWRVLDETAEDDADPVLTDSNTDERRYDDDTGIIDLDGDDEEDDYSPPIVPQRRSEDHIKAADEFDERQDKCRSIT